MAEGEELQSGGDRMITCQSCGGEFLFSEHEQRFFAEMGFVTPRYCPACRKARKRNGTNRSREWKEFYEVTCDRCGAQTTVPFKPVHGRPVYCKTCLQEVRENQESAAGNRFSPGGDSHSIVGLGYSRIEDSERPYDALDEAVEGLLDTLFGQEEGSPEP